MSEISNRISSRNSSIELLRIFCMLGVIILHYNNPDNGAAFSFAKENSLSWWVLHFFESVFIIAVDVFMIISGYFLAANKKINFWRPIELIIRVILYSAGIYLLSVILGKTFSVKSFFRCFIPCNYFVILYCAVYIVSPYVNLAFSKLSIKQFRIFVLIAFLLFSVEPWSVFVLESLSGSKFNGLSFCGISGSQAGYDFVNFLFMYLLGVFLRKEGDNLKSKKLLYLGISLICILCILFLDFFGFPGVYHYEMPLIVIYSASIFCLFVNFNFKSKIINLFASGSFSVFLLHFIFMDKIKVEWACSQNIFVLLLHIFTSSILIYLICFCCHLVYDVTVTKLLKWLQLKKRFELCIEEEKTTDE